MPDGISGRGPSETRSEDCPANSREAKKAKARKASSPEEPAREAQAAADPPQRGTAGGFPIVGIGASAGGLEACEAFFRAMPADSGVAFVIVVHLDPTHVSIMPELLQRHTKMPVVQAAHGEKVEPNTVYVIPPNRDLALLNGTLVLEAFSRPRGANLPIDSFFHSLAQDTGAGAVCIILSGTGTDGTLGLKAVKAEVGMVMVQDEASAKYDGMPRSALATGLVDFVLPPEEMPEQLVKYVRHATRGASPRMSPAREGTPEALERIFVLLRTHTKHDFSLYKKNTICRRVERRMAVHQIDQISDYVRYLQESDQEVGILFKELLIGVTSFFRDPQAFEALRDRALMEMLKETSDDQTIRVWVPGCSSGEEAYSVAIVLQECAESLGRHLNVQIFGTDIDEDAINVARSGLYPASISADMSPERLRRHFTKEDAAFRIRKGIREMLVFAPQNVIKDPPFTKLDLVCCRNLLIYLEGELQQKLLPLFHYSLRPEGILFLGTSETIGQDVGLFRTVDRKWKIFRRTPSAAASHAPLGLPAARPADDTLPTEGPAPLAQAEQTNSIQLVETILRESGAPPCAVFDESHNVVYIHGRTGRYLEPPQGAVSVDILEMARPGLRGELSHAVRHVARNRQEVVRRGLQVQVDGETVHLDLTVKPIPDQAGARRLTMALFEEAEPPAAADRGKPARRSRQGKGRSTEEVEEELRFTKESLQTTIEELETSNEELKSTNEELQSTNEELQSTNEELETSKEELQSLNEESATVNVELQSRIDDLAEVSDDMRNLLDSTDIATLFLDTELCIRRFTPKATEIIPLAGTDSGRPLAHFTSNLEDVDLVGYAEEVLKDLAVREVEVRTTAGRHLLMQVRPYRTVNNVIDGVVVVFSDITALKDTSRSKEQARLYTEAILETVRESLVVLDGDLKVVSANRSFYRSFQVDPAATDGRTIYELGSRQWDIPRLRELLEKVIPDSSSFDGFEVEHEFEHIGRRKMVLNARRVERGPDTPDLVLLAIEDVTDRSS